MCSCKHVVRVPSHRHLIRCVTVQGMAVSPSSSCLVHVRLSHAAAVLVALLMALHPKLLELYSMYYSHQAVLSEFLVMSAVTVKLYILAAAHS